MYITLKTGYKRYLLVIFSFVCALMSKPMVVTLPVIMILLDTAAWTFYVKERQLGFMAVAGKNTFFYFVAIFSVITLFAQYNPSVKHFLFIHE